MARSHSEIVFTLNKLMIGSYNILADTFGTAVELPEPQTFEFGFEADTDQIKAQGYMRHTLAVTTHATFKLASAGIPFAALAVLTGASNSSSVVSPNQLRRLNFSAGGAGLPYFAIVGQMVGEQGDDIWVGLPCCKLSMPPGWKAEQNKFVIGETKGLAIKPDTRNLVYYFGHETAVEPTASNFAHIWG